MWDLGLFGGFSDDSEFLSLKMAVIPLMIYKSLVLTLRALNCGNHGIYCIYSLLWVMLRIYIITGSLLDTSLHFLL